MKKYLLGLVSGLILGVSGYLVFDEKLTPDGVVIEVPMGTELYSGTFSDGDVAHPASGSYSIVAADNGGRVIVLNSDFKIVGAPDPHVKINGQLIAKTTHGGLQVYPIPNLIGEEITDLVIYCNIAKIDLAQSTINKI